MNCPQSETPATTIVFRAVDEVNANLPVDLMLEKERDVTLLGNGRMIDSLGLMILLSSIERFASESMGRSVRITLEDADDPETDPLQTLGTLIDYVDQRL